MHRTRNKFDLGFGLLWEPIGGLTLVGILATIYVVLVAALGMFGAWDPDKKDEQR